MFRAACFDLLTALLDSGSLWDEVAAEIAGDRHLGRPWRDASLRLVTASGRYRPYEPVVAEAAQVVGVPVRAAARLLERWAEVQAYPDSVPVLRRLEAAGIPLVVVTNTSSALAAAAAARLGVGWTAVLSAEEVGWYKPSPQAYAAGVAATGHPPSEVIFVAGSAHDAAGAPGAGLAVYWANRRGAPAPAGSSPLVISAGLDLLPPLLGLV